LLSLLSLSCRLLALPAIFFCAEDEGSPLHAADSGGGGGGRSHLAADRRQPGLGSRTAAAAASPAATNGELLAGQKRPRDIYDTPDLPSHADRHQWLESQAAAFEAVTAAAAAASAATASGGGGSVEGVASDGSSSRMQKSGAAGGQLPAASSTIAKHAAIFSLVYGLLDSGDDRRCVLLSPISRQHSKDGHHNAAYLVLPMHLSLWQPSRSACLKQLRSDICHLPASMNVLCLRGLPGGR
jgi:hypothetical protein